ncbi:MAG: hypothetical protein O2909_11925 [Chloroflexi bacterium]|nr:hypothetical protein [Chloroflexota bacterium]MDA1220127.1 hypothetical protein [Chloroflexota bacterium]PKB58056.1 MAG: hypothetical protein BZY73_00210 [SAR202 cluster bacterium Casp-Chloro-G3]
MAKYPVVGSSYIEVDDSGGTPRVLSPYVDEIEPLGEEVSFLDVTGLNDTARRIISGVQVGQEFLLRGVFDDTASSGPDVVLSGIVGQIGTISYGPAGSGSGRRKVTGEFLCLEYRVISKVGNQVRFEARFKQDDVVALTSWA